MYLLDQLAQRWHVDPERLEELRADTVLRGLEFMRIEAEAERGKKARNPGSAG